MKKNSHNIISKSMFLVLFMFFCVAGYSQNTPVAENAGVSIKEKYVSERTKEELAAERLKKKELLVAKEKATSDKDKTMAQKEQVVIKKEQEKTVIEKEKTESPKAKKERDLKKAVPIEN